jgi:hypothetical protein
VEQRAREIAYYRWLQDTGITHNTDEAKHYRVTLGLIAESDYLLHLYPEALSQAQNQPELEAVGCGSGGCTL